MRIGPVGFLFLVVGGWAAVRAVMLWPERHAPDRPRRIAWQPPLAPPDDGPALPEAIRKERVTRIGLRSPVVIPEIAHASATVTQSPVVLATAASGQQRSGSRSAVTPIHSPEPVAPDIPFRSRFSVSAWSIVRGRSGPALASAGQLGGSQAGVRMRYDFGSGLAAALRVSGPLRSRLGKEAAVALDWRLPVRLPVTFTIERRIGLDSSGRDAFAAGVFGGVDAVKLPLRLTLDGYGQAGVVGLKHLDPYADGAVRLEHPVARLGAIRLGAGAGLWGGAQPGVLRLDAGPQIVAHVPLAKGGVRIGAEWRERVAGRARPGSGFALSLGADF